MHGEAYANLKYRTYAEMARQSGKPETPRCSKRRLTWKQTSILPVKPMPSNWQSERSEFARRHHRRALREHQMYKDFARQAREDGDLGAGNLFEQIAADEGDHYETYKRMLAKLQVQSE